MYSIAHVWYKITVSQEDGLAITKSKSESTCTCILYMYMYTVHV